MPEKCSVRIEFVYMFHHLFVCFRYIGDGIIIHQFEFPSIEAILLIMRIGVNGACHVPQFLVFIYEARKTSELTKYDNVILIQESLLQQEQHQQLEQLWYAFSLLFVSSKEFFNYYLFACLPHWTCAFRLCPHGPPPVSKRLLQQDLGFGFFSSM